MKRMTLAITVATAIIFIATNSFAVQGKGRGAGPKSKPPAAPQMPKVQAQGSGKVKTTPGQTVKVTGQGRVKTSPAAVKSRPNDSDVGIVDGNRKSRTSQVGTGGLVLTPVQQKLQKNTNLANKLSGRLPAGTNLMLASEGFRNLGQFVAAVNVSNNLNIPFADLKTRMVTDGLSLGQAIKAERSDVDFMTQARRAETDADLLIRTTDTQITKKPKKQ